MCWLIHNWGSWEEYIEKRQILIRWDASQTPRDLSELWQKRTCRDCGKTQHSHIKEGYGK